MVKFWWPFFVVIHPKKLWNIWYYHFFWWLHLIRFKFSQRKLRKNISTASTIHMGCYISLSLCGRMYLVVRNPATLTGDRCGDGFLRFSSTPTMSPLIQLRLKTLVKVCCWLDLFAKKCAITNFYEIHRNGKTMGLQHECWKLWAEGYWGCSQWNSGECSVELSEKLYHWFSGNAWREEDTRGPVRRGGEKTSRGRERSSRRSVWGKQDLPRRRQLLSQRSLVRGSQHRHFPPRRRLGSRLWMSLRHVETLQYLQLLLSRKCSCRFRWYHNYDFLLLYLQLLLLL